MSSREERIRVRAYALYSAQPDNDDEVECWRIAEDVQHVLDMGSYQERVSEQVCQICTVHKQQVGCSKCNAGVCDTCLTKIDRCPYCRALIIRTKSFKRESTEISSYLSGQLGVVIDPQIISSALETITTLLQNIHH